MLSRPTGRLLSRLIDLIPIVIKLFVIVWEYKVDPLEEKFGTTTY